MGASANMDEPSKMGKKIKSKEDMVQGELNRSTNKSVRRSQIIARQ